VSASRKKNKKKGAGKRSKNSSGVVVASDNVRVARVICGIVLSFVTIYTVVVLVSYLFTWSKDQSLLCAGTVPGEGDVICNSGGRIGIKLAELLFSRLFGLASFAIPFLTGALAVRLLRICRINLFKLFVVTLPGMILFSVFCSHIDSLVKGGLLFANGAGGLYGYTACSVLVGAVGNFGTALLLLIALLLWSLLLTRKVAIWFDRMIYDTAHRASSVAADKDASVEAAVTADKDDVADEETADGGGPAELIPLDEQPFEEDDVTSSQAPNMPEDEGFQEPPLPTVNEISGDEVPLVVESSENDFLDNLTEEEKMRLFDPRLDLPKFQMPPMSMLLDYRDKWYEVSRDELEKNKQRIVDALANYKIRITGIVAKMGPTVTLYRIRLAEGIKIAQVRRLEEDIAISLGTKGVRVVTLRDSAGIEVPNEKSSVVPLKSVLNSPQFKEAKMELPLAMGITVTNEPFFLDLAKMPHLLVAGATGMGKSVGLNCIITSLLYTKHPTELKFVLVDPKKVELSLYSKLEKHYLAMLPDGDEAIITETKKVVNTLKSLCIEMDDRYELLKMADVRQVRDYNEKFLSRRLNPVKGHKYLPYIVVIVDEFADLLMTAGREVEEPIARLAQKARAVGIHLVIATQRPTTNIITGTIKANFNARIAFYVNSMIDSRTILDTPGANRLIGRGDMLVMHPGADLTRVQCALVDTPEIINITKFINEQRGYDHAFYLPEYVDESEEQSVGDVDLRKRDKLFEEAAKIIVQYQQGSTSLLQRKLNLGYNRAGRLMDQLEAAGIVGPSEGSKARGVLIADFDTLDRRLQALDHQTIL